MKESPDRNPPLKKQYLQEVIFDVRFQSKEDVSLVVGALYEKLKTKYPTFQNMNVPDFPVDIPEFGDVVRYRVYTKDRKALYSLGRNVLTVNTLKYTSFTNFFREINEVLTSYLQIAPIDKTRRLGLRYINNIPLDRELTEIINVEVKTPESVRNTTNSFQYTITNTTELGELTLRITKNKNKNSIVLDLDLYKEQTTEKTVTDITRWVDDAHTQIYNFFKELLTENYFKELSND